MDATSNNPTPPCLGDGREYNGECKHSIMYLLWSNSPSSPAAVLSASSSVSSMEADAGITDGGVTRVENSSVSIGAVWAPLRAGFDCDVVLAGWCDKSLECTQKTSANRVHAMLRGEWLRKLV